MLLESLTVDEQAMLAQHGAIGFGILPGFQLLVVSIGSDPGRRMFERIALALRHPVIGLLQTAQR